MSDKRPFTIKRVKMSVQVLRKRNLGFTDEEAEDFRQKLVLTSTEVHKEIVGLDHAIKALIIALLAGVSRRGHVLFEAAPGRGKTLLVKVLAEALDLKHSRVQGTPDHEPMDFLYTHEVAGKSVTGILFTKGPMFTNILLVDELNRIPPKSQSELLEPMEEAAVTYEGQKVPLPFFYLFATQNPIETEGTYGVSEALMDRFLFKEFVDFPNENDLAQIIARDQRPKKLEKVINLEEIVKWSKLIYDAYVTPMGPNSAIVNYISRILIGAYHHPAKVGGVRGESPSVRPGEDLRIVAGINAFLRGADKPSQEDVSSWTLPVLRGRYPVSKQAAQEQGYEGDHINKLTDSVIRGILDNTSFVV